MSAQETASRSSTAALTLGAIGVVYGVDGCRSVHLKYRVVVVLRLREKNIGNRSGNENGGKASQLSWQSHWWPFRFGGCGDVAPLSLGFAFHDFELFDFEPIAFCKQRKRNLSHFRSPWRARVLVVTCIFGIEIPLVIDVETVEGGRFVYGLFPAGTDFGQLPRLHEYLDRA